MHAATRHMGSYMSVPMRIYRIWASGNEASEIYTGFTPLRRIIVSVFLMKVFNGLWRFKAVRLRLSGCTTGCHCQYNTKHQYDAHNYRNMNSLLTIATADYKQQHARTKDGNVLRIGGGTFHVSGTS